MDSREVGRKIERAATWYQVITRMGCAMIFLVVVIAIVIGTMVHSG